jgi:hypothetical protein
MAELNKAIMPIEAFIRKGVADKFFKLFGMTLTYVTTKEKKATKAKQLGTGGKYPVAFAVEKSYAVDETRYSPRSLGLMGLSAGQSSDGMLTATAKLLPIRTTYEISIYTDDARTVQKIAKTWLYASVNGWLNTTVDYGPVTPDIQVTLDREIQIPEMSAGIDEVAETEMIATIVVSGYLSPDNLVLTQAVTEVQLEGVVGTPEQIATLSAEEQKNHQVFLFRKPWNNITGPTGSANDDPV